jgi:hypothetical protein
MHFNAQKVYNLVEREMGGRGYIAQENRIFALL